MRRVIFDCDGVLMDSEPVAAQLLRDEVVEFGWVMSAHEANGFTGLTWTSIKPIIEKKIGQILPPSWIAQLQQKLFDRLARDVKPMAGAANLLASMAEQSVDYCVASNSSHREMQIKFSVTGLWPLVAGRLYSASDVERGKPAPDLFLLAAGPVAPSKCLVIEDSLPGITAAHAAGMAVVVLESDHALPSLPCRPLAVIKHLHQLNPILTSVYMTEVA